MKSTAELTVYSIIERLQRQLERQGMTAQNADRVVATAVRELARR
jgi:hypothetical protein